PGNRDEAEQLLGAALPLEWPLEDLLDVLPLQAAASGPGLIFGIWVLVERETKTVVGDAGFKGPPLGGVVEIGYSVVPDRRRRAMPARRLEHSSTGRWRGTALTLSSAAARPTTSPLCERLSDSASSARGSKATRSAGAAERRPGRAYRLVPFVL